MLRYRALLEALKWSNVKEILLVYSYVSSSWVHATSANELWDLKCEECSFPLCDVGKSAKSWYRRCSLEAYLPVLSDSQAIVFSLSGMTSRTVRFNKSTSIDVSSSYCFTGLGTVLSCGGSDSAQVYCVNIFSGEVHSRSAMLSARSWGGIVRYGEFVYVIGGSARHSYVQSGEKYHIASDAWKMLKSAPKQPRDGFTPFVHQGKLYCVGHWKFVETMDLKSELFTIEKLKMPHACDHWTVSAAYRNQVTILKTASVLVYRLDPLAFVSRKYTRSHDMYWSNCPPVKLQHYFFFIANRNKIDGVMRLDAENGETVLVASVEGGV